jgi:hypothetical protein
MMEFTIGLVIALVASFGFIVYQAIMLKRLSEELKDNLPPF